MINNVPSWASASVQSFRDTKSFGQGSQRVDVPASEARKEDGKLSGQFEEVTQVDETDIDLAKGERGKVTIDLFGTRTDVFYNGNSAQGELVQTVSDQLAAYASFSPQAMEAVVVMKGEDGKLTAQGLHIDRQNPAQSFAVVQGEGFNLA